MREQTGLRKDQFTHRRKVFERAIEAQRLQKLFRFRKHTLGLVAKAEQSLLASRTAACVGYRQHFVRGHIRRHAWFRISSERAIATIIATQVGKRNEDFSGIADRIAFEAIPDSRSSLE